METLINPGLIIWDPRVWNNSVIIRTIDVEIV